MALKDDINQEYWVAWILSYNLRPYLPLPTNAMSINALAVQVGMTLEALQLHLRTYFPKVYYNNDQVVPPIRGPYIGSSVDWPEVVNRKHKDPFYPNDMN